MLATRPPREKVPERIPEAPKTQQSMSSSLSDVTLGASEDATWPSICLHLWHVSRSIQRTKCHLHKSALHTAASAAFIPCSFVPSWQIRGTFRIC